MIRRVRGLGGVLGCLCFGLRQVVGLGFHGLHRDYKAQASGSRISQGLLEDRFGSVRVLAALQPYRVPKV